MRSHVIVGLCAFGLGVLATFLVVGDKSPRAVRAPAPPVDPVPWEQRYRESEAEKRELAAKCAALEQQAAARVAEESEGASGAAAKPGRAPAFVFPAAQKGLVAADWKVMGEAMAKLMPLLSEAADVAHGNREMRAALWGDILQSMGPIYTQAIEADQAGVPWSSPSFLANLVHATLREAGQPLDAGQEGLLRGIGLWHYDGDTRRLASYGEATPRLRQMADEARMEDRFFADVDPILRDEQRAVLYPPGVRGIVGLDVFGSSSVWDENLGRLKYADRAGLRAAATEAHMKELGLRPELQPAVAAVVAEWEHALPDAFVQYPASAAAMADVKMETSERVLSAADRQLALYEALLARAALDDDEKQRILEHEEVLVPLLVR